MSWLDKSIGGVIGAGVLATAASLADLRSITSAPAASALLAGVTSAADGGGGQFNWDPSSTLADNGGTIVAITGQSIGRLRRVVSGRMDVRWFGAKGDGVTNDTQAIASAFAAAKSAALLSPTGNATLYFPPGTWRITQGTPTTPGVDISAMTSVTLEGDGDLSIIKLDNIDCGFKSTNAGGLISVRKLAFIGTYSQAIFVQDPTAGFEVVDCDFSGFASRIAATGHPAAILGRGVCNDVTIEGNFFHGGGEVGNKTVRTFCVVSSPTTINYRWSLKGNTISKNGTTCGLALYSTTASVVDGNSIDLCHPRNIADSIGGDGYGVLMYDQTGSPTPSKNRITNNHIKNTAGSGIYLQTVQEVVVTSNQLENCCTTLYSHESILVAAIAAASSDGTIISHNRITGGSTFGIAYQGTGIKVDDNTFNGTAEPGVWCSGSITGGSIKGNDVRGVLGRLGSQKSSGAEATFAVGAGDSLVIKIDGGSSITTNFQAGDNSGPAAAARIQAAILAAATMTTPATGAGTAPPTIDVTGTPARPDISLLVACTTGGALGVWSGRYSPDGGQTWIPFTSAASVPVLDAQGAPTGISMGIHAGNATADNTWTSTLTHTALCTAGSDFALGASAFNSILLMTLKHGASGSVEVVSGSAGVLTALSLTASGPQAGAGTHCIASDGSSSLGHVEIAGNTLAPSISGGSGMYFQTLAFCAVHHNTSHGAGGDYGFAVLDGTNNVIDHNVFDGHTFDGIYLGATTGVNTVDHNVSKNNGGFGVTDAGSNNRILDNLFTGNGANAQHPNPGGSFGGTPTGQEARGNIRVDATAARSGNATLAGGTSGTITNREITGASKIRMVRSTQGASPGHLSYATTPTTFNDDGTVNVDGSFVITSSAGGDTGHVDWEIVH